MPLLALTATATHKVCADLQEMLRIPGCDTFQSCVNRPNLFYQASLPVEGTPTGPERCWSGPCWPPSGARQAPAGPGC